MELNKLRIFIFKPWIHKLLLQILVRESGMAHQFRPQPKFSLWFLKTNLSYLQFQNFLLVYDRGESI